MFVTIIWGVCVLIGVVFCVGAGYFAAWHAGERRVHELNDGWVGFLHEQQARWKRQWREEMATRDTEEMQATPVPLSIPLTRPARPAGGQRSVPRPPISHPLRERHERQVGR